MPTSQMTVASALFGDSEYCELFDQANRPNMLAVSELDAYPVMFFPPTFGWVAPLHQQQ